MNAEEDEHARGPDAFAHLTRRPIRDLGLAIEGTALAPVIATARAELDALGLGKVRPTFYLSTEWGVAFGTVAVAIPLYLASDELSNLHAERDGHVEGVGAQGVLRYLRHELGHVVNYAFRLYERPEWALAFGPLDQPYEEDYRPVPFDRRFARHLPGWYAQKHPDEDWAETFAVCVTPGKDWRSEYAGHPVALAKLELCATMLASLAGQEPLVHDATKDEDVVDLRTSLEEHYGWAATSTPLAGDVASLLRDLVEGDAGARQTRPLAELFKNQERVLMAEVYKWSGHFPERTRALVRQLTQVAEQSGLTYPAAEESRVSCAVHTFVTALAVTFVQHGRYLP